MYKRQREILAIRRQLVQDGKVSNNLGISFTAVSYTHLDVYKRQSLSSLFSVVFQDYKLLSLTVADNISASINKSPENGKYNNFEKTNG